MSGLDWDVIKETYEQRLDIEEASGRTPVERDAIRRAERLAREAKEARRRNRTPRAPGPRPVKYDRNRMRELYAAGASMKAVARDLGCDQWTVSKALRSMNVTIRPQVHPGRPRKDAAA